jgi:YidC/Oxa1 family membrane protein insertase
MDMWTLWLDAIRSLLTFVSASTGLGLGLGVIAMTIALRTALLPLTWGAAWRGCIRQKKLQRLQPQLAKLKEQYSGDLRSHTRHMRTLYERHGLKFLDGTTLLGALAQIPILLGVFQVLRDAPLSGRFLWIANLARPDVWLALIMGLATTLLVVANPDLPQHLRFIMIVVPTLFAVITALKFSSALVLFWTMTNLYSALQTVVLHRVVARRIKSGALRI